MNEPDGELEQPPTASPRRSGFAAFRRVFSRFASAFLLLFLLLAAAFAVSSGFREKVAGFVTAAFDREAPAPEPVSDEPQDIGGRNPRWLPQGQWTLEFHNHDSNISFKRYTRPDGARIDICMSGPSTTSIIDTQDAEIRNDILIMGHPSVMSIKENCIILSWMDEEIGVTYILSIIDAPELMDPAVVLKIAENLD